MRITESQLRSIIREEQKRLVLERVIREVTDELQQMFQQSGAAEALKGIVDDLLARGFDGDDIENAIDAAVDNTIGQMIQHSLQGGGDIQR